MCACVHVGVAMGGCEQLVARHCLALRLVGLGMASFRDESQIFGHTNWDLVGKHAEERRLAKLWRVGPLAGTHTSLDSFSFRDTVKG